MRRNTILKLSIFVTFCSCASSPPKPKGELLTENNLKISSFVRTNLRLKPTPLPLDFSQTFVKPAQNKFGKITGFDDSQPSSDQNFFCKNKFEEAVLNDPCHETFADDEFPTLKPVATGDFDGDGLSDSIAQLVLKGAENQVVDLIWFQGESTPRFLQDFTIVIAPAGQSFTDATLEAEFIKAPNFLPERSISQFPRREAQVTSLFKASLPETTVRGNLNEFKLGRSLIYESINGPAAGRILVFSKSRDRVMIAVSEEK